MEKPKTIDLLCEYEDDILGGSPKKETPPKHIINQIINDAYLEPSYYQAYNNQSTKP